MRENVRATFRSGKCTSSEADVILEEIHREFLDRLERFKRGEYKPELPEMGWLGYLGYKVGNSSEAPEKRREILMSAFKLPAPDYHSYIYAYEWGDPETEKRLQKLVFSLDKFLHKQHFMAGATSEKAILDWSDDLIFIKRNLYDVGTYRFRWPKNNALKN